MCGVVGHKPSYGIISGLGQIPGPPGTLTQADIAVIGPTARTVDDWALGLSLMAGADDWYAPAWDLSLPPARTENPAGLRVAVPATNDYCPVDLEIERAILGVADQLEQQGARVDRTARPQGFDFAKADGTFLTLLGGAMCGGYSRTEIEDMAERLKAAGGGLPGDLGIEGATTRHREWLSANERRLQMRARSLPTGTSCWLRSRRRSPFLMIRRVRSTSMDGPVRSDVSASNRGADRMAVAYRWRCKR